MKLLLAVISSPTPRISHGETANKRDWPSQAVIEITSYFENIPYCGGSIISEQWVLSAAHCAPEKMFGADVKITDYKLKFDVGNRSDPNESYVLRNVIEIVKHPLYESQNYSHDIALFKMDKPLDFDNEDKQLKPMCLDIDGIYNSKDHRNCYMTGFGRTNKSRRNWNNIPSNLQQLQMKLFSHKKCAKIYRQFYKKNKHLDLREEVTDLQLCMSSMVPGKGAGCPGDSGGPLQCKIGSEWHQVGVTWSVLDCDTGPTVFQSVTKYKDFIVNTTGYELPDRCRR